MSTRSRQEADTSARRRPAASGLRLGGVTRIGAGARVLGDAGEAQYLDACVAEAQLWLGAELTAYLAGAASPAELAQWVGGVNGPVASTAAQRLRVTTEVIELFEAAGCGTAARAWLREAPDGGGRGPAQLIRQARTDRELDEVRRAALRHVTPTAGESAPACR